MNTPFIVYTINTNRYDSVRPIPPALQKLGIPFLLFTDNPLENPPSGWTIRPLPPVKDLPFQEWLQTMTSVRIQRLTKILPWLLPLPSWETSLYVDGTMEFISDPRTLIRPENPDLSVRRHPRRNDLYQELQVCADALYIPSVQPIQRLYTTAHIQRAQGLQETGILLRRNTSSCRNFCILWALALAAMGTHRDQLGFEFIRQLINYVPGELTGLADLTRSDVIRQTGRHNYRMHDMRPNRHSRQGLLDLLNATGLTEMNVVEVGCYAGASTSVFLSSGKISRIYCVDPWRQNYDPGDPASDTSDMVMVEQQFDNSVGQDPRVVKHKGTLADLPALSDHIDLVYIDAIHTYDACRDDILAACKKLHPRFIAGHDYLNPYAEYGVKRAVQETLGEPDQVFCEWSWLVDLSKRKPLPCD